MNHSITLALTSLPLLFTAACSMQPEPTDDLGEAAAPLSVAPFVVAAQGCSMAHCDPQMSDQIGLPAPSAPVYTRWQDTGGAGRNEPAGASVGLGCSSNGEVAACSYGGYQDNLVVYRANGSIVFRKTELDAFAWTSAPLIDDDGGVIAADGSYLYRYGPLGVRYWRSATPGGIPISPVITTNGTVVLATNGGPLSSYRSSDGAQLDQLALGFDTANTPGVSGNRIYVSTANGNSQAKLVAIDVAANGALSDGWGNGAFFFTPNSGASPAVKTDRIFFDGHIGSDPYVFCVRDDGNHATLQWQYPMPRDVVASLALDPRGGIWTYGVGIPDLTRLRESDGAVLQTIDINALVGGLLTYTPSSVMSIAGDPQSPVMIVSARAKASLKTYVTAIDLNSGTLLWKEPVLPWTDSTAAQFAIVEDDFNRPVVVFPSYFGGARGIAGL